MVFARWCGGGEERRRVVWGRRVVGGGAQKAQSTRVHRIPSSLGSHPRNAAHTTGLRSLNFRQNLLTDVSAWDGCSCKDTLEDLEFRDNQLTEVRLWCGRCCCCVLLLLNAMLQKGGVKRDCYVGPRQSIIISSSSNSSSSSTTTTSSSSTSSLAHPFVAAFAASLIHLADLIHRPLHAHASRSLRSTDSAP